MRRVRGVVQARDHWKNEELIKDLKTSFLSEMIEERQLRYLGHSIRYPDDRMIKFMLFAERPGQQRTGKRKQYMKEIGATLDRRGLSTEMMKESQPWKMILEEVFQRPTADSRRGK